MSQIPPLFREWQAKIEQFARDAGLVFPEIVYELLDYKSMSAVAAYDGFPVRFPHWRWGMDYDKLEKSYSYGLQRIYEMVINTVPCYAYLLESNLLTDQKTVMAHVCGHADFFANNMWFAGTNRDMMNEMANHSMRTQRYMDRWGMEKVENFIDDCMSIANLIDMHGTVIQRREKLEEPGSEIIVDRSFKSKSYMDPYVNQGQKKLVYQAPQPTQFKYLSPDVDHPEYDILLFLLENAILESWQYDILDMIREEAYYFVPYRQTKIMNEGWASYIHSLLMTTKIMDCEDLVDYAEQNAGVLYGDANHFNPYRMGLHLFRDIEDRWNRGAFGREYEECQTLADRKNWDKKLGLGRQKIFEVRKIYNDLGFIDEFISEDFVREYGMVTFKKNAGGKYDVDSEQFAEVKKALINMLINGGSPMIQITDGDYGNGGLLLKHIHDGRDLDVPRMKDTMGALYRIWGKPIILMTTVGDTEHRYKYDTVGVED